jgi:hypothetical protein
MHGGSRPHPRRLAEAIQVVRAGQDEQGRWRQDLRHAGEVWLEVGVGPGEPSKWLTLHALRVLDWSDTAA